MATAVASLRTRISGVAVGAVVMAALVGVVFANNIVWGVALLFAALYLPLSLMNLPLGVAMWLPLLFMEGLPGAKMVPEVGAVMLTAAWIGVAARGDPSLRAQLAQHRTQLAVVVALLVWLSLSIVWAADPGKSATLIISWVEVAAFFLVVATALHTPAHARLVATAFVVGAVLSVLIGVAGQVGGLAAVEQGGRFQGAAGDPNYLAAQVVAATALAVGLLASTRNAAARWWLLLSLVPLTYALVAAQSRGGFVAAATMLIVAFFVVQRHRLQLLAIAMVVVAMVSLSLAATPGAWQRLTSGEEGGSGRTDLWTIGWRMVEEHPFLGVGLDNFGVRAIEYTRQPGQLRDVDLVERGQEAHNLYLGLVAETGLLGLVLFLVVAATSLAAGRRAAAGFDRVGMGNAATLARAAVLALVGMLSASFFLPNGADKRLWVLLALGPALLGIARAFAPAPAAPPRRDRAASPRLAPRAAPSA